MNKNIDLTEILKGCEHNKSIVMYSPLFGKCNLVSIRNPKDTSYPIIVDTYAGVCKFTKDGKYYCDAIDSECILFPSKDQRDWSKFVKPIPKDTSMMVSNDGENWKLRYYATYYGFDNTHYCFTNGGKSSNTSIIESFKYTIPYDKFNPNNIEESLKYNIQQ